MSLAERGASRYGDIVLDECERSEKFKIYRFGRPWYRSFHFSWLSFFFAFFGWFAFVPALDYLVEDESNDITIEVVRTSNIFSVLGTVFIRLALGPLCEIYGPRRCQTAILVGGSILVACSSAVKTANGLIAVRFFIGLIGGAFVPCQYWMTMMFASNTVGTANAVAGGWGNLGGGFANLAIGGIIKGLREGLNIDDDTAWRIAFVIPAVLLLVLAIPMFLFSDDCPQGLWENRIYNTHSKKDKSIHDKKKSGFLDYRVWLLALQYACCFGVELTINNTMANYLYTNFEEENCIDDNTTQALDCSILGKDNAAIVAGLFGLMNLFARALGGLLSDFLFKHFSMRGRLFAQFICLLLEGVILIIFSRIYSLPWAIFTLILFSVFVQSSEGATFSITPFVCPTNIGQVSGIVGAGGNIGAVSWSSLIKGVQDVRLSYFYLGWIVCCSAFLTLLYPVQGAYLISCKSNTHVEEQSPADTHSVGEANQISRA